MTGLANLTIFGLLLATGHNIFVKYSNASTCNFTIRVKIKDPTPCDPYNYCNSTCPASLHCCCRNGYNEKVTEHRRSPKDYTIECEDIDECKLNKTICGPNMYCSNTAGSYKCLCLKGFRNISNTCIDIDECKENFALCGPNMDCENTEGSYRCHCLDGFLSINNACVDCRPNATHGMFMEQCANYTKAKEFQKANERIIQDLTNSSVIITQVQNEEEKKVITEILHNVEKVVLDSFLETPRTQQINTTELDITMKLSKDICHLGVRSFTLVSDNNAMDVPCDLVSGEEAGAVLVTYKNLNLTADGNILFTPPFPRQEDKMVVNSKVVTGAITNPNSQYLSHPLIFTLSHLQALTEFHTIICVFWDPIRNGWSDQGCMRKQSNSTATICSCTHLSSFALLMATNTHHQEVPALTILTYVGLSVSILCLCLSLLTFILCRSLRSAHTSVLTALCGCLFMGQLLFLVGIRQTRNKILCAIIAGCLQFSFLAAFCWMSIESVLLFMTVRNLRAISYMSSRKSNFPLMCLLGFGIPAAIVGISAAVHPGDYGTASHCWLNVSIIWSFLGPLCVFIFTNAVLLTLTIHLLRKSLASVNTNVSTLKNNRLLTFKAMAQFFILGCTWGIGYFQFGPRSLVISYLFTIFNSIQGVYIFLVHCLLNQQIRAAYCRLFYRAGVHKRQTDTSTTGSCPRSSKDTTMSDFKKTAVSTDNYSTIMKEQSM